MYRVFWFLAGTLASYIGNGYLEGLLGNAQQTDHAQKADKEEK